MPDIYWLIAAQRRLQEAMPPAMTQRRYAAVFQGVCRRLAATFPEAAAVVVRDRLRGYRNHSDRHILIVEVLHRTRSIEAIPAGRPGGEGPHQGDGAER